MSDKSLGLKMLWWAEVIVSGRALLFFIPLMINKWVMKTFTPSVAENWFVMAATITALLYLLTGLASLLGHKLWRLFHYISAVVVLVLTAGVCSALTQTHLPIGIGYFIPAVAALVITAGTLLFGRFRPA